MAYTHACFFVAFRTMGVTDLDPRPRPAAGLARGWGMIGRALGSRCGARRVGASRAAQAEPVDDFYRGKTIES